MSDQSQRPTPKELAKQLRTNAIKRQEGDYAIFGDQPPPIETFMEWQAAEYLDTLAEMRAVNLRGNSKLAYEDGVQRIITLLNRIPSDPA